MNYLEIEIQKLRKIIALQNTEIQNIKINVVNNLIDENKRLTEINRANIKAYDNLADEYNKLYNWTTQRLTK